MQIQFEGQTCNYNFGVNEVNGVFIKIYNRETSSRLDFYEFPPTSPKFITNDIEVALNNGDIDQKELEEFLNYTIGNFHVYFENIMPAKLNAFWPEEVEAYEREGNPAVEINNLKQYFNFISMFKDLEFMYSEVVWVQLEPEKDVKYVIQNNSFVLQSS